MDGIFELFVQAFRYLKMLTVRGMVGPFVSGMVGPCVSGMVDPGVFKSLQTNLYKFFGLILHY